MIPWNFSGLLGMRGEARSLSFDERVRLIRIEISLAMRPGTCWESQWLHPGVCLRAV